LHLVAGSLERELQDGAVSVNAFAWYCTCRRRLLTIGLVRPLPEDFLRALAEQEEVLVSSRDGDLVGTVPVWFIEAPPGVVYLFTFGFSVKARRWRSDPWVRLTIPGTRCSVEGEAHLVDGAELEAVAPRVVERWSMQGAPSVEGLRRTVRDGMHVLVRVDAGSAEAAGDG
jgi:hypothetical protein